MELAPYLKIEEDISMNAVNNFISGLISQFQEAYTVLRMTSQDFAKYNGMIIKLTPRFNDIIIH